MAKSKETYNKIEKEKIKQKKKKDKEKKKEERRANAPVGGFDNMIAYVDENGNLSSTPPNPLNKKHVRAEDIEIGIPKNRNLETVELIRKGILTFFNESKGFGFIKDEDTHESIFTHINGHIDKLKENDRVSFRVERGQKGLNAVDVKLLTSTKA